MSGNLSESQGTSGTRIRNLLIAIAAIALSVAIFFGFQTQASSVSLETQAEQSTPIDVALSNGKPTLTEFYANWCTSCQAMAKDLAQLKEKYADSVNFAMLNVDNSKWLPEILRYRVDGIPHFVFMNREGEAIAQTIGEQPLSVMEANLDALIANNSLPYAYSTGQTSTFNPSSQVIESAQDDPRSHGAQVK
ncbi:thioredoxin fold domain-containing protein [Candidatus Gracilibacteria bacterium]|nr:thioredoxin fold domain-containing protein [Candidatus Gracilibacteria bacterium]NJM87424.1 thioredoxin fold domain-containing protein [Hydrococcus sp. RU_2_2]NJQ98893.1 thioredoxin fold domain-containing protein [Hydrococcus sp. CSU_1_8]